MAETEFPGETRESAPTETAPEELQLSFLEPPPSAAPASEPEPEEEPVEGMHEHIERQHQLLGATYKIHPPVLEHALYITINNIVLNPGTEHELKRPFEIFINSKNMEHFEWVVALTRIMSAVFRKGGNLDFIVEELTHVFSPRGGYFKQGSGKWMHSVVAEIGTVIEHHLIELGMLEAPKVPEHLQRNIDEAKRKAAAAQEGATQAQVADAQDPFAATAQLCSKCHTLAVLMLDGCLTCMSCGDSKCG